MISITGEMRDHLNSALADRMPCLLGTASGDGQPQISIKGSILVYDDETLAYWERAKRSALENVGANPKVVVFYRNPAERVNLRFQGTATIHDSGPIKDEVANRAVEREMSRDPERNGVAVLIKVDRIIELSGNVLQERD
ncbi:MAG: pyridoxamine 5'-phosphate oxidase family protein [SAR202 cluster bacterium]|jgi:hypothetical protein|nr:hypothetical protein [Chloroflexota bacterium]MDP6420193.1 pyridoxamine 5'-phosphate oxidase family protein [SAR202 cluster bacterium]HAL47726.1 hypothetical protein [Dehalococcoidia bacterium]MDP6664685.1 pyridoxamine 5'-phosphate oxidase family protein [SAR202 cluster bacterium]MDP6800838.1 pyridoxamine 5'-phosphate oxidase family protein [SAR202 cluster bacterium]|tara:strand:+ start:544 stop:963 length:420 start_codon:yes stop_codon:yes gene_type:complete